MGRRYELIYGYRHCKTESVFSAGFADSEAEAAAWVRDMTAGRGMTVLERDPSCDCEASFCPLKFQRPWFAYREIPAGTPD